MAKITDLSEILLEIDTQLNAAGSYLLDYISMDLAKMVIATIYLTNNINKAVAFDFQELISIISSEKRISVIINKEMSYYKQKSSLCAYEELDIDIRVIIVTIDTAIARARV